jgi:hypothetical protein
MLQTWQHSVVFKAGCSKLAAQSVGSTNMIVFEAVDRADKTAPQLRLGLKPNINQFLLLILVNAFVGAMIGLEQTVVPLLGKEETLVLSPMS